MLPDQQPLELKITLDAQSVARLVTLFAEAIKRSATSQSPEERRLTASRQALFAGEKPPEDRGLLIDQRETAKLLKVSPSTVYNMHKRGEMPPPIRIGKAVRWSYEELQAWTSAGCPKVKDWKWPTQSE